jgi:hypothetical protein
MKEMKDHYDSLEIIFIFICVTSGMMLAVTFATFACCVTYGAISLLVWICILYIFTMLYIHICREHYINYKSYYYD